MKINAIRPNFINKIQAKPQVQKMNYKTLAKDEVSFRSNPIKTLTREAYSYIDEVYNPFNGILDNFSAITEIGINLIHVSRKMSCDGYEAWWDAKYLKEALDKSGENENLFVSYIDENCFEITEHNEDGKTNIALFDLKTNEPIEYRIGVEKTIDGYSAERIYKYNSNNSLTCAMVNYRQDSETSSWEREFNFGDGAGVTCVAYDCAQTENGLKTAKRKYDYELIGQYYNEKLVGASYDYIENQDKSWTQAGKKFFFDGNILKGCAVGFEECKKQNKTEADKIFIFANRGKTLNHVLVDYSSKDNKKITQKCFTYDLKTGLPQDCKFIYEVKNMF